MQIVCIGLVESLLFFVDLVCSAELFDAYLR